METRSSLLVGLVLLLSAGALMSFVLFTQKDIYGTSNTYTVYGDFEDASGIRGKTRVQINGIDVGKIESIKHYRTSHGGLVARVEIKILNEFEIYRNASLKKEAESLLGDYRIDLNPGTPNTGKLVDGDVISDVKSRSDLQELQTELKAVAVNVHKITDSFASALGGPEGSTSLQNIVTTLEKSMLSIQKTTEILERTVEHNEEMLNGMISDMRYFARRLAATTEPDGKVTSALGHVDKSAENITSITKKIDEGKGTLGQLVNERSISDKLEQALENANTILGSVSRIKTELELRSEYAVPFHGTSAASQAGIKNYIVLRLYPKPDKFYQLEAVSDPRGVQRRTVETTTPDSTGGGYYQDKVVTQFNDLKFSLQFGKRYYFAALRFGFIENTGGLGVNLYALNDKLEFRFDVFDFNRRDLGRSSQPLSPRLRGFAMFQVVDHVFVQAGLDDPLNKGLFSWFIGGGIRFTDDDLRGLLIVSPKVSTQ